MSKAVRTRAYNKAFGEREVLQAIGLTNMSADGIWRNDKGEFVSAYPGRPGKVTLFVTTKESSQRRCTFGRNEIDDMRAFVNGEPTKAEKRAMKVAAVDDLLEALERVGCQDKGSCGPSEPDGRCFVCAAIQKARGQ